MADPRPIGIFDSGIGGLTVASAIRQALPRERLLYFGDTVHMPYGMRSLQEVQVLSASITEALLAAGAKLIVVACNTASGAALGMLREHHPQVPFVGMEPAVKPAAAITRTGTVGVIATVATFRTERYASVVQRFGRDVRVLHQPCPGLAKAIEAGESDTPGTETMLRGWLEPMLAQGMDALVLGCTHYPLARPLIERIVGPGVHIIDPAPAVARQVERLLTQRGAHAPGGAPGGMTIWTSGEPAAFRAVLEHLRAPGSAEADVRQGRWLPDGKLSLP